MLRIGKRREEYFAVAQAAFLKRSIENLSAIQEKSGYPLRQRGIERFVGKPEVIRSSQDVHDKIVSL